MTSARDIEKIAKQIQKTEALHKQTQLVRDAALQSTSTVTISTRKHKVDLPVAWFNTQELSKLLNRVIASCDNDMLELKKQLIETTKEIEFNTDPKEKAEKKFMTAEELDEMEADDYSGEDDEEEEPPPLKKKSKPGKARWED